MGTVIHHFPHCPSSPNECGVLCLGYHNLLPSLIVLESSMGAGWVPRSCAGPVPGNARVCHEQGSTHRMADPAEQGHHSAACQACRPRSALLLPFTSTAGSSHQSPGGYRELSSLPPSFTFFLTVHGQPDSGTRSLPPSSTVPEPAVCTLFSYGLMMLLLRRSRSTHCTRSAPSPAPT